MSVVSPSLRTKVRASIEAPVAAIFIRLHLTPNMLTLIGFGICVFGAVLAGMQMWSAAAIVVAFGSVFDLFDGALARATGKSSKLGAFLDSVFDRASEAAIYIGVAFGFLRSGFEFEGWVAMLAMAAAFMVSYTRAKSESQGFTPGSGMANIGVAPREVRIAILTVGLIVLGFAPPLGLSDACFATSSLDCPFTNSDILSTSQNILAITLGLITVL